MVTESGQVLGKHSGIIHYTIGQRKGIGVSGSKEPLYVVKLDVEKKLVVVGPRGSLTTRYLNVKEINWLGEDNFLDSKERTLAVRVRSTRSPKEAIIKPKSETDAIVELITPEEGISKGQACVFYGNETTQIFGGGWIC